MTSTPMSPEDFMALPPDPEEAEFAEDFEDAEPGPPVPQPVFSTPPGYTAVSGDDWRRLVMESMAASLQLLAEHVTPIDQNPVVLDARAETEALRETVIRLERDLAAFDSVLEVRGASIAEVLEICKPSTSKLADKIRAALAPVPAPKAEAPPEMDRPPATDAPVEEWRTYARGLGHDAAEVDSMNRSQIRTLLGIGHDVSVPGGAE